MKWAVTIFCFFIAFNCLKAQKLYRDLTLTEKTLYNEHIVEGQPDPAGGPVYVRQGYILQYSKENRLPKWVAYHIIQDYLNTPKREKRYKSFRNDPDMDNPVRNKDYTGSGYARGHMAPYFAMGGDRDGNGVYSELFDNEADSYDDKTVFQANYMSNIAPQDQNAMNGAGGPWYALETIIRKILVEEKQMELNVVIGGIIDNPENRKTLKGKYGDVGIVIPDRFFQVLIYKDEQEQYITAGFLFPHVTERSELPFDEVIDYLVPVDAIEEATGFNFLNKLSEAKQRVTESIDNREFWQSVGF